MFLLKGFGKISAEMEVRTFTLKTKKQLIPIVGTEYCRNVDHDGLISEDFSAPNHEQ